MTGLAGPTDSQAVTIHFGAGEFTGKYKMLVDNFSQWQANTGRVQSIDLQYMRQVVVNPDTSAGMTAKKQNRFIPGERAWRERQNIWWGWTSAAPRPPFSFPRSMANS